MKPAKVAGVVMSTIASKPHVITPDEFERMPDAKGFELVEGRLVEKNVSVESSQIAAEIIYLLKSSVHATREAVVFEAELAYRCYPDAPEKLRRPDVSVVRRERMTVVSPNARVMPIPADLVVEVISPTNLAYAVSEKIEEYIAAKFPLVWVVDPKTRTVTIHRQDGTVSKLHEPDIITGESALPGFSCQVAEFFKT
jgi:Uma2 family endonuclease